MPKRRPIITIDCETDPFKRGRVPMPFLWGLYDGERYRDFPDARALMRYLETQDAIIYAHNGGKFDYGYLYQFLEPYTEALIISGRLARFTIGNCEFRDSWNILPVPLRDLGKDEIDFAKLEPGVRERHMDEIKRYNRRDCVSLWEAVTEFVATYSMNLTLAGAAMKFWSKSLGNEKPASTADFYEQIKPYYYGGRVQCFHKGIYEQPFHVVDINSAYPFAMIHKHPLSVKASTWEPKPGEKIIPQSLYTVEGVSRGALPFRDESKALVFPDDGESRSYHCTGWELQAALDTGRLGPWVATLRLDFLKELDFVDYVDHFYQLKASSKKGSKEYIFAKLLMNSLYGKFGANPDNYSSYGIVPSKAIVETMKDPTVRLGRNYGPWDWAGMLGSFGLMEGKCPATGDKNPVESPYYNAATAASITGFVRAYLLRHIDHIEKAGGQVLYCDTDSLVYNLPGEKESHPFTFSKKLGDWSHEGSFDRGAIAGKKLYAFHYDPETWAAMLEKHGKDVAKARAADERLPDEPEPWKTAHKGVKLEAEQIVRIAAGEEITWEAEAPVSSPFRKLKTGQKEIPARFLSRRCRRT